jgi:hypothetical protein
MQINARRIERSQNRRGARYRFSWLARQEQKPVFTAPS